VCGQDKDFSEYYNCLLRNAGAYTPIVRCHILQHFISQTCTTTYCYHNYYYYYHKNNNYYLLTYSMVQSPS